MAYINGNKVLFSAQIGGGGSSDNDMLQARVDVNNSCAYLFFRYEGNNVDYIAGLDTSNVTSMGCMFQYCENLTTIPLLDTSNVVNMVNMFWGCENLTTIPLLDTSNVVSMQYTFNGCTSLTTIPLLNTSNVTDMGNMFLSCSALTTIPQLDTSKVTSMFNMFCGCTSLTTIPQLDTSMAYSMTGMFNGCQSLTTIPLLDMYSLSADPENIFRNCTNLTNLTLKNVTRTLEIASGSSWGHLLTQDSLINTLKELWDYSTTDVICSLTMGEVNLAKLSDVYVKLITPTAEQIAEDPHIESKKPCVVCSSTDEGAMLITDYASLKGWTIS